MCHNGSILASKCPTVNLRHYGAWRTRTTTKAKTAAPRYSLGLPFLFGCLVPGAPGRFWQGFGTVRRLWGVRPRLASGLMRGSLRQASSQVGLGRPVYVSIENGLPGGSEKRLPLVVGEVEPPALAVEQLHVRKPRLIHKS